MTLIFNVLLLNVWHGVCLLVVFVLYLNICTIKVSVRLTVLSTFLCRVDDKPVELRGWVIGRQWTEQEALLLAVQHTVEGSKGQTSVQVCRGSWPPRPQQLWGPCVRPGAQPHAVQTQREGTEGWWQWRHAEPCQVVQDRQWVVSSQQRHHRYDAADGAAADHQVKVSKGEE